MSACCQGHTQGKDLGQGNCQVKVEVEWRSGMRSASEMGTAQRTPKIGTNVHHDAAHNDLVSDTTDCAATAVQCRVMY